MSMDPDGYSTRPTAASRAGDWGERWSGERRAVGRLIILVAVVIAAFAAYRWLNASYEARRSPHTGASARSSAGPAPSARPEPRGRGAR